MAGCCVWKVWLGGEAFGRSVTIVSASTGACGPVSSRERRDVCAAEVPAFQGVWWMMMLMLMFLC